MNLLLLFVCVALQSFSSSSATSLKFLLMAPKSRTTESSAVVPAVDQTLRQINRNFTILPQHHLEYILSEKEVYSIDVPCSYAYTYYHMLVLNSQCNEIEALESFINAASDSSIVAVVGCGWLWLLHCYRGSRQNCPLPKHICRELRFLHACMSQEGTCIQVSYAAYSL